MKKQNNIGKYLAKAAYAMAFVVSLCACTDDNTTTNSYIEEGIPVEIGIKYATPEMTNISTRGLNPSDEEQVNDLYILIFNESGNERKEGSKLYTSDEIKEGKITINTTSGNSRIYAIANVQHNQQQNLQTTLNGIKDVNGLNKAYIETALIDGVIDVDRTSPNLVMSGAFVANGVTDKPTGYCPITIEPTQDFTGKGNIELVHFDSHIKFRIRTTEKVTKFEPKTWQVLNVPKQSFLIERAKENAGTEAENYGKSTVYNNQNFLAGKDDSGKNIHTFEFYQFENFKNSKNGLTEAKDREKEVKVSGKNTGEFYYVEPHATYVEFTASMELVEDGVQRIADVRFTVLLGGKDSKDDPYSASNFNTWRNKKYTYDVTINGVDDITTEVGVEDGKPGTETRPGIEGDVIDANGEVRILDAHYNCFNIALTRGQVEGMSILVHTPFDEIEYVANDETKSKRPLDNRDYKWIKFKRRPNSTNNIAEPLAQYGGALLDIYSLREDVLKQNGGNTDPLYYTVFVDEYYYEEKPCDKVNWGSNPKTYWTHFVNQDPRYIMLVYTPKQSEDGESSWSKAQYFIRQKSIQTYYSTTNLTEDGTALGMEHVNESKIENHPAIDVPGSRNVDNGFHNCKNFFDRFSTIFPWLSSGDKWSTFVEYKVTDDNRYTNTVLTSTPYSHAQCLSRNRDKNGDGKINTNEMEWYLPTFNQISGMYLGATSLPSPLFTPSGIIPAYDDPDYHFATSDGDKIWAQEGCSNNGPGSTMVDINLKANAVRCVRNLGLTADESINRTPKKPYSRTGDGTNAHFVYDMSKMAPSNLRTSPSNTLNYHDNFTDTRNKPYRKFELAKTFTGTISRTREYSWAFFNNGKDYCQDYFEGSETDATRGKGKWRTPNQRELLIIYNTGSGTHDEMAQVNYGMYSCTYWTYGKYNDNVVGGEGYRTFGFNASGRNMYLDNNNATKGNHANDNGSILRCVRDY